MSIRELIAGAIVAALNVISKPVGIPDARVRRPNPQGVITEPEINVFFLNEGNQLRGNSVYKRSLTVVVECRAFTTDPEQVDAVLEPLLTWTSRALNGSNNLSRTALSLLETGTTWFPVYLDKIYSNSRTNFLIEYQTSKTDPDSHA